MNCPVCHQEMVPKVFGPVHVDICETGCKGLWFDWHELTKLDEQNEGIGKALEDALNYPRTNDENRERLNCPKCNIPMFVHRYSKSKEVNVDECYNCAGFFLDSGELKEIRDSYMSSDEEQEYLDELINSVPFYDQAKDDLEKQKERTEAIHQWTKYLRISYYLRDRDKE